MATHNRVTADGQMTTSEKNGESEHLSKVLLYETLFFPVEANLKTPHNHQTLPPYVDFLPPGVVTPHSGKKR